MQNLTRHSYLAVLAFPLLLVGCGVSAPAGVPSSSVAEATLKRVKAPPGFRVGKCKFMSTGSNTQCYRRKPFMSLNESSFRALIKASGLTLGREPLTWCSGGLPRRRPAAYEWYNCEGRAELGSVKLVASVSAVKVLRGSLLSPRDLKVARGLRGTIYEVAIVTKDADS
jgi:hypothetical protein